MPTREELLANELHKFYRAANLANLGRSRLHDHGFSLCSKKPKEYFLKRARLILKRAEGKDLNGTLQEIENQLTAKMIELGTSD